MPVPPSTPRINGSVKGRWQGHAINPVRVRTPPQILVIIDPLLWRASELTLSQGVEQTAFNQPVVDDINSCPDHQQGATPFNIGQDGTKLAYYSAPEYSYA